MSGRIETKKSVTSDAFGAKTLRNEKVGQTFDIAATRLSVLTGKLKTEKHLFRYCEHRYSFEVCVQRADYG
jgi:hypothetical protein